MYQMNSNDRNESNISIKKKQKNQVHGIRHLLKMMWQAVQHGMPAVSIHSVLPYNSVRNESPRGRRKMLRSLRCQLMGLNIKLENGSQTLV